MHRLHPYGAAAAPARSTGFQGFAFWLGLCLLVNMLPLLVCACVCVCVYNLQSGHNVLRHTGQSA